MKAVVTEQGGSNVLATCAVADFPGKVFPGIPETEHTDDKVSHSHRLRTPGKSVLRSLAFL